MTYVVGTASAAGFLPLIGMDILRSVRAEPGRRVV